jgi:hypothetical protein
LPTSRGTGGTVRHPRSLLLRRRTGILGTSTQPGSANSMTCGPLFCARAGGDQRHAGNSSGNGQAMVLSSSGDAFSALAMPPATKRWHRHCSMPLADCSSAESMELLWRTRASGRTCAGGRTCSGGCACAGSCACAPLLASLCAPRASLLTPFSAPGSPFLTPLRTGLRRICGRRRGRGGCGGGLGSSG